MANLAALRAAVFFAVGEKPEDFRITTTPGRARVNDIHHAIRRIFPVWKSVIFLQIVADEVSGPSQIMTS